VQQVPVDVEERLAPRPIGDHVTVPDLLEHRRHGNLLGEGEPPIQSDTDRIIRSFWLISAHDPPATTEVRPPKPVRATITATWGEEVRRATLTINP
jgi:hypothetical protein